MRKLLLFLSCLIAFSAQMEGMSLPVQGFSIKIDSLSKKDLNQNIELSLKYDSIPLLVDGRTHTFFKISPIEHTLFAKVNDSTKIEIRTNRLLSFTTDSILIFAQYKHTQENNNNSLYTNKNISIPKDQLTGISYWKVDASSKKVKSLFIGYNANLRDKENEDEKDHKIYHIAEIGFNFAKMSPYWMGYNLYAANEFVVNSHKFFVGPKVGANAFLFLGMVGSELIYYTDLKKTMLTYKPYISFGIGAFKCSLGYNITIFNNDYFKMNSATIGITVPLTLRD